MNSSESIAAMEDYYRKRAPIYDTSMGYDREEVVRKHQPVVEYLTGRFANRTVLEIACGPGFWTEFLARSAAGIVATDFNVETLAEARKKNLPPHVSLRQADAYDLPEFSRIFDGCFAGDWFCHVPISKRLNFLDGLHRRLAPGALVVFCDQMPHERSMIDGSDSEGDNIQIRTLPDGSSYSVIKNFPTRSELPALFSRYAADVRVIEFSESRRYIVEYECRA
jgi:demethylmenaquinone methyltransferase/2-methoxy-6-polyprenyl-1,4-benzoquinol methylase